MTTRLLLIVLFASGLACSTGSPTGPTTPAAARPAHVDAATAVRNLAAFPPVRPRNFSDDTASTSDVSFPPRNEALRFRLALEDLYRDRLRRAPERTFVDAEGTVVWVQEYLRYRVNRCSHAETIPRVLDQVDGIRTAPVCGTTTTVTFPPRNEPYEFMLLLESHYQVYMGRPAGSSYVDVLGNVVWTQEYLRYRLLGCPGERHFHDAASALISPQLASLSIYA